jgi:hypothetical protein
MYKKQQNVYYSVEVRERFDYCFEIIRKENNKDRKGMFFFISLVLYICKIMRLKLE